MNFQMTSRKGLTTAHSGIREREREKIGISISIRTKTIHSHCGQVLRRESFFSFPLLIPSYPVRVPAACSRSPVDQLRLKHQEDRALLTRSTGTGRNPPHLQEDTQRHRQRDNSQVQHRRLDKLSDPDPQGTKHHIR